MNALFDFFSIAVSSFRRRFRFFKDQQLNKELFRNPEFYYNSTTSFDYYEHCSPNLALDVIERAGAALEVSIAELLGSEPLAAKAKPGPQSQLQRKVRAGQAPAARKTEFRASVSRHDFGKQSAKAKGVMTSRLFYFFSLFLLCN